jgi:hypothetical protein
MKMGAIRIEANDDGTYQVEVDSKNENREAMPDYKCYKYSAANLEEVITKIKEAQEKIGGMKEEKKDKKSRDKSLTGFMGMAKPSDD